MQWARYLTGKDNAQQEKEDEQGQKDAPGENAPEQVNLANGHRRLQKT